MLMLVVRHGGKVDRGRRGHAIHRDRHSSSRSSSSSNNHRGSIISSLIPSHGVSDALGEEGEEVRVFTTHAHAHAHAHALGGRGLGKARGLGGGRRRVPRGQADLSTVRGRSGMPACTQRRTNGMRPKHRDRLLRMRMLLLMLLRVKGEGRIRVGMVIGVEGHGLRKGADMGRWVVGDVVACAHAIYGRMLLLLLLRSPVWMERVRLAPRHRDPTDMMVMERQGIEVLVGRHGVGTTPRILGETGGACTGMRQGPRTRWQEGRVDVSHGDGRARRMGQGGKGVRRRPGQRGRGGGGGGGRVGGSKYRDGKGAGSG
jgi:hypothetical protein